MKNMQGLGMVSILIFYIINYIYLLYMRTHKADVLRLRIDAIPSGLDEKQQMMIKLSNCSPT